MLGGTLERADALLGRAVHGGRVDYEALCEDDDLREGLRTVGDQRWEALHTREEQVAFVVNAYNLAALGVACRLLRRSPRLRRRGLRGWGTRLRFFLLERVRVARRARTLFGLEFLTLRGLSRDPRLHFALVCATGSCPPLKEGVYRPDRLDEDLEAAARAFLRPGVGYALDREGNVLRVSRIFRWYRRDFRRHGGPAAFVARYGAEEDAAYLEAHRPPVVYEDYDWGWNATRSS